MSITTTHEKMSSFNCVKDKRKLPVNSKMVKDSVEGRLIMALTETDPVKRPSAKDIKDKWIPRWNKQILK